MYKVLLVDDEPAILEAEKRAISQRIRGFEVIAEAYSVDRAIEIFEEIHPEVVLTDMKMPRKSGIELIKYIGQQEEKPAVCIAVSGYSDFHYVHDAFLYGGFDYLLKPIEPAKIEELFNRIQKLLASMKKEQSRVYLSSEKPSGRELVSMIEHYVKHHLSEDNSIIRICSRFMISQPYLSKIFKKYEGCTYNEYIINLKITEAKKLLECHDCLIGEVAEALGFTDQFYFSKVFKNAVGCTPREYRKQFLI